MFLAVIFPVTLSIISVMSYDDIQTYRINIKVPGGKVNEDVVVDKERNVMTVNVGDVSQLKGFWCQSINLHDFEKKKVAIKNIDYGICLILDTKETYSGSVDLLDKIKRMQFQHEIKEEIMVRANRITHDEMLKLAGEKIADFCRGYKLYHGKRVHHDGMIIAVKNANRVKRAMKKGMRDCSWWCGSCSIATTYLN
ncbi:uncharacterized protein LOC127725835 [Mytilus californianus]|uniref:uncharacterized protein LOC127725835 n=1 Tax=Mytilus californianus TaxID=6549 RepID=UPI00224554E5|nr:uncharacterized protein LOC127725835 [Mytilus californianus]